MNGESKNPTVSVLMNCHNSDKYLREAIDSVYAQTYKDWEIIFWDNASTDKSAEIAQSYDSKLKYFKGDEKVTLGKARNYAMAKASGEYIAFLDCDDIWLPEKLEKQLFLLRDKSIGISFTNALYFHDDMTLNYNLYDTEMKYNGMIFGDMLCKYDICLSSVILRRNILNTVGEWFYDKYNLVEDADMFLRTLYHFKAKYKYEVLTKYRIHANNTTGLNMEMLFQERIDLMRRLEEKLPLIKEKYNRSFMVYKVKTCHESLMSLWREGKKGRVVNVAISYMKVSRVFVVFIVLPFIMSYRIYNKMLSFFWRRSIF